MCKCGNVFAIKHAANIEGDPIPCSNLSYLAAMLTDVAALTPQPAYTNIYITLNEL